MLWSEKMLEIISILFFAKAFVTYYVVYPRKHSMGAWKECVLFVFVLDVVSCRYQWSTAGLLCHLGSLLPYLFCLYDPSIDVSGVLKSPNIIALSISPSMSVSICCIYLGAPVLGVYMLTNVISSSCIYPYIIM